MGCTNCNINNYIIDIARNSQNGRHRAYLRWRMSGRLKSWPHTSLDLEGMSEVAIALLKSLLERDPSTRLGMSTAEHEWIAAGCPGSPLKKKRLSVDGGDPLAAPLPNRRLTAQKTFKVSPRLTGNLPPAAPQLAPFPPLMSTALTPQPVPVHHPRITDRQARQSKRLKKAQLAVISASRLNKGSESFRSREAAAACLQAAAPEASRDGSRVTTPLSGIRDSD